MQLAKPENKSGLYITIVAFVLVLILAAFLAGRATKINHIRQENDMVNTYHQNEIKELKVKLDSIEKFAIRREQKYRSDTADLHRLLRDSKKNFIKHTTRINEVNYKSADADHLDSVRHALYSAKEKRIGRKD
jgi:hypothetical protein